MADYELHSVSWAYYSMKKKTSHEKTRYSIQKKTLKRKSCKNGMVSLRDIISINYKKEVGKYEVKKC